MIGAVRCVADAAAHARARPQIPVAAFRARDLGGSASMLRKILILLAIDGATRIAVTAVDKDDERSCREGRGFIDPW